MVLNVRERVIGEAVSSFVGPDSVQEVEHGRVLLHPPVVYSDLRCPLVLPFRQTTSFELFDGICVSVHGLRSKSVPRSCVREQQPTSSSKHPTYR